MKKIFINFAHYFILALTLLSAYDVFNHDLQHATLDIVVAILLRLETNELKKLKQ